MRSGLLVHADTIVCDCKHHALATRSPIPSYAAPQHQTAARWHGVDCVRHQIIEHLADLSFVTGEGRESQVSTLHTYLISGKAATMQGQYRIEKIRREYGFAVTALLCALCLLTLTGLPRLAAARTTIRGAAA